MGWLEPSALFNAASTDCVDRLEKSHDLVTAGADFIVGLHAQNDAKLAS